MRAVAGSAIARLAVTLVAVLAGAVAVAPAAATPIDPPGVLTFGGLPRTYVLHVPPGLTNPAGLVISLHGSGQNEPGLNAVVAVDFLF